MSESDTIETKLKRFIQLLEKAKEDNWVIYFGKALDSLNEGNVEKSKKRIRGAYGGMGSFNDAALNFINNEECAEVLRLRSDLWDLCELKSLLKRIFK